jgi:hypothetical protein
MTGLVKLLAGARLMPDGADWTVKECWPQSGRVVLHGTSGERRPVMIPFGDYASQLAACIDSGPSGTIS